MNQQPEWASWLWSAWHRTPEDDIRYVRFMYRFLSTVTDKTVLELGSFVGHHTEIMLKFNPKKIICVEPDRQHCQERAYRIKPDVVTLYNTTANDYYANINESVDVVLCCGLLNHLHSPLHLIEKIINVSKPKYLLIETTNASNLKIDNERFSSFGNARPDKDIEFPILKCMAMPISDIIDSIETTNYKMKNINHSKGQNKDRSKTFEVSTVVFERVDKLNF